jgi:hypothetical protein
MTKRTSSENTSRDWIDDTSIICARDLLFAQTALQPRQRILKRAFLSLASI